METPLATYKRIVAEQPIGDEAWFIAAIARFRAGDTTAAREISGRFLRVALELAQRHTGNAPDGELFDCIEEANGGLMGAITTYAGADLPEFLRLAELRIKERLGTPA